jgi:hypothetical protein
MRAGDLRGDLDVVVGHVGLGIVRTVLEFDVHPHPELVDVEPRGAPVDPDPLAGCTGFLCGEVLPWRRNQEQ